MSAISAAGVKRIRSKYRHRFETNTPTYYDAWRQSRYANTRLNSKALLDAWDLWTR